MCIGNLTNFDPSKTTQTPPSAAVNNTATPKAVSGATATVRTNTAAAAVFTGSFPRGMHV